MTDRNITISDAQGRRLRQHEHNKQLKRQADAMEEIASGLRELARAASEAVEVLQMLATPPVLTFPSEADEA